jgi:hypothetical protein
MQLKIIAPILFIFLIACSQNKVSEKSNNPDNSEKNTSFNPSPTSISAPTFCDGIEANIRQITDESIVLKLSDQDIDNRKFKEIEDEYYTKFIEPNEMFRKRKESYKRGGIDTSHYYFAIIKQDSNCLIIVYEYFTLNHSENKLFLIAVDANGNLLTTLQIAELTNFAGGIQSTYSKIKGNRLLLFAITHKILGPYNEETNQYQYLMDSITVTYNIEDWSHIELVTSDTTENLEYWK